MIFHCLFEQSGTFKNVFKSHGHRAYDYDLLNQYGQTDYQVDLFKEIEAAWDKLVNGKASKSIFDTMAPGKDFVFAFFPCTYFSNQNELVFQGHHDHRPKEYLTNLENINFILDRNHTRAKMYELFLKFCFVLQELEIPAIIENPYSAGRNYLNLYSPFRPAWVELDRSKFGDDKIKPTMYFALNFEMHEEFMMYDQIVKTKPVHNLTQRQRSEISPRYTKNFYQRFLSKQGVQS